MTAMAQPDDEKQPRQFTERGHTVGANEKSSAADAVLGGEAGAGAQKARRPQAKDRLESWGERGRPVALRAMIDCGAGHLVHCTVTVISERGARILVANADGIPTTFTLSFASDMKVRRQCTVLSREPGGISVQTTRQATP
jgi:hypothetical protein